MEKTKASRLRDGITVRGAGVQAEGDRAPGVYRCGQDVDVQASVPVFSLTCDRRLRKAAVCLFICLLSVHHGVSFRPQQRGEKTNETTNEIRERD